MKTLVTKKTKHGVYPCKSFVMNLSFILIQQLQENYQHWSRSLDCTVSLFHSFLPPPSLRLLLGEPTREERVGKVGCLWESGGHFEFLEVVTERKFKVCAGQSDRGMSSTNLYCICFCCPAYTHFPFIIIYN